MIYAYVRVSTDKQDNKKQKHEVLKFADQRKFTVDKWIEETVSGIKNYKDKLLWKLIKNLKKTTH